MKNGNEVEVITGMPNYPKGNLFEGYSIKGPYRQEYKGIRIYRVPVIPRGKGSSIKMVLNYLSFMICACFRILPLLSKKYDRVFAFQTSPITAVIPAIFYSRIKKINSYIYIQDLWPETFYTIVPINNIKVRKVMKNICINIYNKFTKILIASRGYREILIKSNINDKKIIYFPQWAENIYSKEIEEIKEDNEFALTFAGNIGKAQSVETIVKAASLGKDNKNIKWNILGYGSEFNKIKQLVDEYKLEDTVILHGRKPIEEMPHYFSKSDALIVTLKDEGILTVTLPAKVQSYMASGKPIIGAISGEGNRIINESNCGFACEAEDYTGLYNNVMKLYRMNTNDRKKLGVNGKEYFEDNFSKDKLLKQLLDVMN